MCTRLEQMLGGGENAAEAVVLHLLGCEATVQAALCEQLGVVDGVMMVGDMEAAEGGDACVKLRRSGKNLTLGAAQPPW